MNLIDLRKFEFETNKIISFNDDEFIFGNTELEEDRYLRNFYIYNMKSNDFYRINKIGIETSECVFYNNIIINGHIYTTACKVSGNDVETAIYKVNIENGHVEKLHYIDGDLGAIILSEKYVLLRGSNYGIDEEHSDKQKDMLGEYEYAMLCDLEEKKQYKINDKRVILGIRDYFIPYIVDGEGYIVFEEAYMEDWELEYLFEDGVKKEDFISDNYRESINIISINKFAEVVKNGYKVIPFKEIHKTELTSWTRYFGMDEENIFFRVKNFESKVQDIYSINKKTLKKRLVKSIKMNKDKEQHSYYSVWHDIKHMNIYERKIVEDNIKIIKELYNENINITLDNEREGLDGLVDEYVITSFWTEDSDGDNYKDYVKIKNTKAGNIDLYEGLSEIINDNVILFN
ncbi:MAG: hypothetical protein K0R54_5880 [Clostridiaceae bacterium]|jgi:hypothetical protein|nr:hypothetical protein [Clostridiaceae bacterium]